MKKMVLWPASIDGGKRRTQGRKVPLGVALPSPTLDEMFLACTEMGISPERADKRYPSEQGKTQRTQGCLLVEKKYPKVRTLKMVCDRVRKARH